MKTAIPTTPAVRRFNLAVQAADDLLNGRADQLTVDQLIGVLANWPRRPQETLRAALELEAAAEVLRIEGECNPHPEPGLRAIGFREGGAK